MYFCVLHTIIPSLRHIKKAWNSTVVVPRYEAVALPCILEPTTRSPRRI